MNNLLTLQRVLVRAYLEVTVSDVEYEEAIAIVEQMMQAEPVAWKEKKTGVVSATIRDERLWTPLYTYPAPQAVPAGWVSLEDGLPSPHQMVLVARESHVTTGSYTPCIWMGVGRSRRRG